MVQLMKKSQFVKIKCQSGHTNLVPAYELLHVYEPIRYEKCKKTIAQPYSTWDSLDSFPTNNIGNDGETPHKFFNIFMYIVFSPKIRD